VAYGKGETYLHTARIKKYGADVQYNITFIPNFVKICQLMAGI
jgi:hypothetical protein